ncbi:MAG: hypothetical protein COV34_01180 [Candidatus Zambryskibacteria bacterium CG10_big_fil_rev_8_21_14_0_10_42_12]|uniref:Uncharacterized protein n=1 Tax=Candidatus Zambryskibacteria bacterium CG10_big_fil_rev_8_21_14_0_10_42_12 TaxID=1975115 RepID=A0A2H0QV96_9BACT|nr:MAG: hypothetical protein COV34_01180 [Candidatus Zambryskibacteria bacterium CG10_big_fil_rev_8_21_14_0_10_42_12]
MLKFILKFGATGSTARWVAKNYLKLSSSEKTIQDVMNEMLKIRYATFNPNGAKEVMNERISYLDNLTDFTFSILQTEGAIKTKEMGMSMQMSVISIIMEELKKKGVPSKAIINPETII